MFNKPFRIMFIVSIVFFLLLGCFSGGVLVGIALPVGSVAANNPLAPTDIARTPGATTNLDTLFVPFWEAWRIVHNQYVDQPVDDQVLMRGAIRGMMEALGDKHTSYMDPEQFKQSNASLEGKEYDGIGAWVDITGKYLTIISPMPKSPALKAGLKAGDQVIAVDGEDVTGVDGNAVLKRILGTAGTKVKLTILRQASEKPFDVEVVRAKIVVPMVDSRMLDNQIAYIQLFTFGENTTKDLRKALTELMAQKPVGLVLDLRNNGGGYLVTAIEVVSEFVDEGKVVMYEEFGDKRRQTFKAKSGGLATKIPLVVLVNEGTASASEITAGAIQDYQRGQLVGITTYGKGSVQNVITLANNEGGMRVTIARWLTPKERQINKAGLKPDFEIKITEEDVKEGRDPQLDKAVELLLNAVP